VGAFLRGAGRHPEDDVTNPFRWIALRLRALFGRGGLERDMQAEINAHLEQATQRYIARGLTPANARAEARREFGNLTVIEEEGRDSRGTRFVESLIADIRFAFRYFARKPLMAATIVAVLALGIGVNSAMVSFIQAFAMRPAPAVPDIGHMRVYGLQQETKRGRWELRRFTYAEMLALAERKDVFAHVAGFDLQGVIVSRDSAHAPRSIAAEFVTPTYWRMVGVTVAGPGFAEPVAGVDDLAVVISHMLAEELFDSTAAAIGQRIVVNDIPVRVVGVAPYRFEGAIADYGRPNMWIPMSARSAITRIAPTWVNEPQFIVMTRLASGVTKEQATTVARGIATQFTPDSVRIAGWIRGADVLPIPGRGPAVIDDDIVITFGALGLVSILILLVACTNVSSLLVAAAVGRQHEIAVRLSMGAPRHRVIRQLVTESGILAITGGVLGLLLYWWFTAWVGSRLNMDITPDTVTIAFTLAFALGTGILFGLSPALHAVRAGLGTALRESGTGATRRSKLQGAFVVAQIVFSQPLLLILAVALTEVVREGLGPSTVSDRVMVASMMALDGSNEKDALASVDTVALRLATLPGVERVVHDAGWFVARRATVTSPNGNGYSNRFLVEGAAPGYFALQEVPIILGRDLAQTDTNSADYPVVIASDVARDVFGDANPIGQTLTAVDVIDGKRDSMAITVVGVFDGTKPTTRGPGLRMYTAKGRHWRQDQLLVRTTGPAEPFLPTLRTQLRAASTKVAVRDVQTLAMISQEERKVQVNIMSGAIGAAALALGIASIGLFSVVALSVGQRRREIGIRIALGGRPWRVAGAFFAEGLRLCAIGIGIGLPLSIAALKLMMSVEFILAPDFSPAAVGLGIAAVMLTVASVATWFPARRAATVDPTLALRSE
jgi:predicted permease